MNGQGILDSSNFKSLKHPAHTGKYFPIVFCGYGHFVVVSFLSEPMPWFVSSATIRYNIKAQLTFISFCMSRTEEHNEIFYPGEQSLKTRNENMESGIPVNAAIWAKVKALAQLN